MLRCCGCVWLSPIIFIDTHNLVLVETDSAKLYVLYGKMSSVNVCYGGNGYIAQLLHLLSLAK